MSLSLVWLTVERSMPLGRNWRSRSFVFSLLPRFQGAWGAANQKHREEIDVRELGIDGLAIARFERVENAEQT